MADMYMDGGREALRRFLAGEDDLTAMLTKVAAIATATVPGCDLASITLLRRGKPTSPAFTDERALSLDEVQYEAGDGPCLAAIRQHGVEHIATDADTRWPEYRAAASEAGVRACLSVALADEGRVLGGLNLYSTGVTEYDSEARAVACEFADLLGFAAANAAAYQEAYEVSRQLQRAMETRSVIEQAKGILMATEGCGPDEAFQILVRASQNQNRKLHAIAAELVERRKRRPTP